LTHRRLTLQETQELIPQMPFNHHLGFRVTRMHKDGLTMECQPRPEMRNFTATLHGGVTATLIDAAIGVAVFAHYGGRLATTVNLEVSYLRPIHAGKVVARARLVKTGKTLAVGSCEVRTGDRKVAAVGCATYMLL
jgi:acyl-CoA thioesterase